MKMAIVKPTLSLLDKFTSSNRISSIIGVLLWLRIGQMAVTSSHAIDVFWGLGLWFFHWRRETGRGLSLLSLGVLLPGFFSHHTLWAVLSALVLGILQLRAQRDAIMTHWGWEKLGPFP